MLLAVHVLRTPDPVSLSWLALDHHEGEDVDYDQGSGLAEVSSS